MLICQDHRQKAHRFARRGSFEAAPIKSVLNESYLCFMKLPHSLLNSVGFSFTNAAELCAALREKDKPLTEEIERLFEEGLPPVVSMDSLAVMLGYNPGFIFSMILNPKRHYRVFTVPKGKSIRLITAPKIGLKIIQKWLSVHFDNKWNHHESVFGFVKGKSHIDAAAQHLGAEWVASVDIENFFPSVNARQVAEALTLLGYANGESVEIITKLTCKNGCLVQGSPCSPILSNIVLRDLDHEVSNFASENGFVFTRYADDIVISSKQNPEIDVIETLTNIVTSHGWRVSQRKSTFDQKPKRLKVHGLLVGGDKLRLTKGYRNKIRAYKHLVKNELTETNYNKIRGHLEYSNLIERFNFEQD